MKTKKIISAAIIYAILFCTFITASVHAKETLYGYSEIAEVSIGIKEDVFFSYRSFNPVFDGETAIISADGWSYGYMGLNGKMIISADYSIAWNFLGDYAAVDKSWHPGNNALSIARFGLIDRKGYALLPLEYVNIMPYNGNYFNEYGFVVVSVYDDDWVELYGAVDKNNNIVIPFEYESIGQFIDGKAEAVKNGKSILLDIHGNESEILVSEESAYEIIWEWNNKTGKGKYGLVDGKGNTVLPHEYDNIWHWKDSLFIAGKDGEDDIRKDAVIDVATGKIIAESNDRIYPASEYDEESDLLILNRGESYWVFGADKKGSSKFGAINLTTGETVIPFEYDYLNGMNNDIISATKDGKVGFIDKENNIVLPFVHDGICVYGSGFVNGKAIICGEKYDLLIDGNNNVIYKTDLYNLAFKDAFNKYGYIAFYERDNIDTCGIMDFTGKIIIPMEYSYSMEIVADKYILCYKFVNGEQSYSIYDLKGNKISKEEYFSVIYMEKTDSFLVYGKKLSYNKYAQGIIDNKANYILPAEYNFTDAIRYESDGVYRVKDIIAVQDIKTEKYGYINSSGEIIVPVIFDYACSVSEAGYAIVQQDDKWKIIRIHEGIPRVENGAILGNVLYSDIVAYINGKAIPTSNANGKTLVAVEDLAKYGFIVVWDNGSRTLRVQRDKNAAVNPLTAEKDVTHKPGMFKCNYLYTDIKTYLSGEAVGNYAINGVTLIDFELLAKYGKLGWDEKTRELRLVIE